ncbi:caspase family protein [Dactylosporangium roseum]|uniref:Caspase family protein n=1 Tax=Dactylosporangium roseum TaxID=47989 RepID=A0ABY5ZD75_9ACTN|nr:caspase family protein [Dactylosporangium roseum]UWZ39526.1 caspase family protein [Dactylosporangium roseum]
MQQDEWRTLARSVKQLSSPSLSALTITDWAIANQHDDTPYQHPVGSLELVVSALEPVRVDAGRDAVTVEPATTANVQAAFDRWYDRCDRRVDNIALFYFCGHGLRVGSDDILLLQDFAESRHRIFDNAVDFRETYRAMAQCSAHIQCYFVDACRDLPDRLLGKDAARARPLKHALPGSRRRDGPIVYSTVPGHQAWGEPDSPTVFATSVRQALDGLAAETIERDWEVRTSNLGKTVSRLMLWNDPTNRGTQVVDSAGMVLDGVVRRLTAAPVVPFRVGCTPRAALEEAHLRLAGNTHAAERPPSAQVWHDSAPAGAYKLSADFSHKRYVAVPELLHIMPPYRAYDLPVQAT